VKSLVDRTLAYSFAVHGSDNTRMTTPDNKPSRGSGEQCPSYVSPHNLRLGDITSYDTYTVGTSLIGRCMGPLNTESLVCYADRFQNNEVLQCLT
jgi:hypothetical protein